MSVAKLEREVLEAERRLEVSAGAVFESCASGALFARGEEVRSNLSAVNEVTSSAYLVALDACRADVCAGTTPPQVLEEMEAARVMTTVPRYGEATRARARVALERLEALRLAARDLANLEPPTPPPDEKITLLLEPSLKPLPAPPRLALLEADAAKRRAADEARRERAEDRARKVEESRRALRGPEALAAALDAADETTAVSLALLLGAILERPDVDARRRLRCESDAFRRDFKARKGLYAVGFELVVLDDEDFLVMAEPDPTRDLDKWAAWFDALKRAAAVVDDRIRANSAWTESLRQKQRALDNAGAVPPPWATKP